MWVVGAGGELRVIQFFPQRESMYREQSDCRRRMNFNTMEDEVLVVNTHSAERRAKKSNS